MASPASFEIVDNEPRLILSIDIGTSESAVAVFYCSRGASPIVTHVARWPGWGGNIYEEKVPSVLIYDTQGMLVSCGAEAASRDKELEVKENEWSVVENFKMHLHPAPTLVKSDLPLKELPFNVDLLKIYSDFLRYLYNHTRRYLRESIGSDPWLEMGNQAEIILTHPNCWNVIQQRFLRKAVIAAELIPANAVKTRLHFFEESEVSTSIYTALADRITVNSQFIVCDGGGSTADISGYRVKEKLANEILLDEISQPSCIDGGGARVDSNFRTYLQSTLMMSSDFMDKDDISDVVSDGHRDFARRCKRSFVSSSSTLCSIVIGNRRMNIPALQIVKGTLTLDGSTVEQFFRPSVDAIIRDIQHRLEKQTIDFVVLTGDFGESPYLKYALQTRLHPKVPIVVANSLDSKAIGALKILTRRSGHVIIRRSRKTWITNITEGFKSVLRTMPGGYSRENLEGGIAAPDVPAESESEASQTKPVLTSPRSDVPGPGTSPKSTSQPSVLDTPKHSKFGTAPPELTSTSPASDIPDNHKPWSAVAQSTLIPSVSNIPKDSKSGAVLSKSLLAPLASGILQDLERETSPPASTVTLPVSDISSNLLPEIPPAERTCFAASDVSTPLERGTSGAEATLTRSAPDERVDSNAVIFPPQLSEVCGLVGRSIDSLRGNEAAEIGSKLHSYLRSCPSNPAEYTTALKSLQDLCSVSGEIPSSYYLKDVTVDRCDVVGRGGEALVYGGYCNGRKVVVRQAVAPRRDFWRSSDGQTVIKLIYREMITHALLDHPNIIPFLGVYRENTERPPMTVLPFIERGSLGDVIREEAIQGVQFVWIITGIGRALAYLHSKRPPIFHGDLHPDNILIGPPGNALLCDFGLSRIRHECTRTRTVMREGGRIRFLAPELSDGPEEFRTSEPSDIFSLAMTFFNVWDLKVPFVKSSERKAGALIRDGQRPERPATHLDLHSGMEGEFWKLIESMWAHTAGDRPSSQYVQQRLETIFGPILEQHKTVAL